MSHAGGPPLDEHQYTVAGLRSYEAIYGRDFVSPGGRDTTAEILGLIEWNPDRTVLDVGCGLGGAAFMMASEHNSSVVGIDMSLNMIEEARRRRDQHNLADNVTLVHGDIMSFDPPMKFDLVHSREVFLHIHDKPGLFAKLREMLKPGGQLLFTDYCRGPDEPTGSFLEYLSAYGYDLRTVDEIAALLDSAGFTSITAANRTKQFIDIHNRELAALGSTDLGEDERNDLRAGWLAKIDRATRGDQRWGWFQARR